MAPLNRTHRLISNEHRFDVDIGLIFANRAGRVRLKQSGMIVYRLGRSWQRHWYSIILVRAVRATIIDQRKRFSSVLARKIMHQIVMGCCLFRGPSQYMNKVYDHWIWNPARTHLTGSWFATFGGDWLDLAGTESHLECTPFSSTRCWVNATIMTKAYPSHVSNPAVHYGAHPERQHFNALQEVCPTLWTSPL